MKTIFRINKRSHPFVQIDRRVFEDPRISWKAKGLLGYLLSRPDDWTINSADIVKRATDGRDSVRAALNELSEFGYATHEQVRTEEGKIAGLRWTIHESAVVKTTNGFSGAGFAGDGKTPTTNNKDHTNKKKHTDSHQTPIPSSKKKEPDPEPQSPDPDPLSNPYWRVGSEEDIAF